MGSHNELYDQYQCKATKQNLIADPGPAQMIKVTIDDGVCVMNISSGVTQRSLVSSGVPVGTRLTLMVGTDDGGSIVVEDVIIGGDATFDSVDDVLVLVMTPSGFWSPIGNSGVGIA